MPKESQLLVKAIQKVQASSADKYRPGEGELLSSVIVYLNAIDDLKDLLLCTFSEMELERLTELLIDMQSDSLSVLDEL